MKLTPLSLLLGLGAILMLPNLGQAQYNSYNVPSSGSDCIMQMYRTPDAPPGIYDAIHDDSVVSADGGTGFFYAGFTHQNTINGNASTLVQYVCWPATGWFAPLCQQIPWFAGTNEVGYPQTGEGSSCAIKGYWPQFKTNLWEQEVMRCWQSPNDPAHVGYQGVWIKDPTTSNWYHVATFKYPFAVTGVNGMSGWQEDFSGYTGNYIVDHAGGYYHTSTGWNSANQINYTSHGLVYVTNNITPGTPEFDPSNPTTTESAVGPAYLSLYNVPLTLTLTNQPALPTFDPIVVSSSSASLVNTQLYVQWQLPLTSSPQLSYLVEVFPTSDYSGSPAVTAYDNDPETHQALLNISGVATPYVRLTITDIFFNTNTPILITPTTITPNAAVTAAGAVGGLGFQYYEAASGNWTALPNFSALTPVYRGAVSFTDTTPRRKRINYGFDYTGYINAPATGWYAFTLHSGDGSSLTIDGTNVISFDGLHDSSQFQGGGIALAAGPHTFDLKFFKGAANPVNTTAYTDGIGLAWQGPGISYQDVPSSAYSRIPGGSEPTVTLGTLTSGSTICSSNLSVTASVTANGNTINNVLYYLTDYGSYYFRPSQGFDIFLGSNTVAPYTLNVPVYAAATNLVRARIYYNSTNIIDSAVVPFSSTNMPVAPWFAVGNAPQNYPVGASIQGGTYTLTGDNLSLMGQQLKGDCTIVAHLASLPGTSHGAPDLAPDADGTWLAGIIMRSTTNTTPGTPFADGSTTRETSIFSQGNGGTYYANDLMLGGNSAPNAYSSSVGSQKWFKIQRVGNQFTNSVSSDGVTWTMVNSTNLATVGSDCYACLFIYDDPSTDPNLNTATFDNVTITGNLVGPATVTVTPAQTNVYAGATVAFTATAGGTQPYTYQWQLDGQALAGATNATLSLTNVQPASSGIYTVVMTDGDSATATASGQLNVLFSSDPSQAQVAITSPTNSAAFTANTTVNLAASVTANSHSVTGVQFYNGGTLLGTSATAPYTYAWANIPAGTFTVIAWVLYDGGSSNSSVPVVISANPLPTPPLNLTVTSPATNLISVSWTPVGNATGYVVSRDGVPVAMTIGSAYQDFSVAPATSYCYSVVATNSFGSSASSITNCGNAALSGNALFWDAGSSPTGPQDGNDSWSDSTATWWNGSANIDWTDGNVAVIGLAATTNCTITLNDNVAPAGIIFGANSGGNYTVASAVAQTLTVPGGTPVVADGNATISAPVSASGSGTFVASGVGTLTISGSGLTCSQAVVNSGTLQVLKVSADCPYVVTNTGTLEVGYTTGGGYATTAMKIYGAGAAATTGFYLAGGQQYNTAGQIQLLGAPTTIRQYGTGFALLSIFDINGVGIWCTAAASGSASDANVEMINEGYGMTMQIDSGANNATGDFTINGPLSVGNLGFYKEGTGSLRLNGVATTANVAVRLLNGTIICGTTNCLGVNSTLPMSSGTTLNLNGFNQSVGTFSNPLGSTVKFGGTCTLTVTNATLAGALQMNLNPGGTPASSELVLTTQALNYGGSLTVTNLGTNVFAAGQTFQLFSAASYAGSFSSISLPALPGGLGWITNLNINGSIQVASGVPTVSVTPSATTNYLGDTVTFTSLVSGGTPPYSYQWQFNGVNIPGAISANLTLTNIQLASSGIYTLVVPGVGGSGTGTARLNVLMLSSSYDVQTLAYNPIAYWRLNEAVGSSTAYDLMGHYNGTLSASGVAMGGPSIGNGNTAPGFPSTNLCAAFTNETTASIQVPAMTGFNTNALTVTGWIYRNTNEIANAGIFWERSGTTTRSGLNFGSGNVLGYTWNNTAVSTTFIPTSNQWTFVAWVMTPTNGKIYMGTNLTALMVFTNTATYNAQNFGATTPYLGYNSAATSDRFFGLMDNVSVYNYSLSFQQVSNLFAAAQVGLTPPTVALTAPADGSTYLTPTTTNINFTATVTANGHTISAVNFYAGTNLIGTSASAPYGCTWNASPGTYGVYAQVVYENGAMNSSLPEVVTVAALPSAPASVTVSAPGTNLVLVQWQPGSYAAGYIISRGDIGVIAMMPATTTNYLDFNVLAQGNYCYSVVATNAVGTSASSPTTCVTVPATGTALVWDMTVAGTHPQDGSGNWGSASTTWWNGTADVQWSDGSVAVFGASPGGSGTVTLTNNVTPAQIIFNTGSTYAFTGSSTINTPASAPITVQANGSASATINVNLQGSTGLYTTGSGTVTLGAQSAYLNGPVTVNGGTLALNAGDALLYTGSLTVQSGATLLNEVNNTLRSMSGLITIQSGAKMTTANGVTLNVLSYGTNILLQGGAVVTSGTPDSYYGSYNFAEHNALITIAGGSPTGAVLSATAFSTGSAAGGAPLTFNVASVTGGTGPDLVVSGNMGNTGTSAFGVVKTGPGTMVLTSSTSTYTGTTTVSNGTLEVDGTIIPASAFTVASGGTLSGNGAVQGTVAILAGGTLAPGTFGGVIGRLTMTNNITLGGQTLIGLTVAAGGATTNDNIFGVATNTLGGSLVVTNLGTNALVYGNTFKLFSTKTNLGSFASITLPALSPGLKWSNSLVANGTIWVTNVTLTLAYANGANGTLTGTASQTVNYGTSGTAVTAVPNAGYYFVNWSDGSLANPRTDVNVTNNISVTANFAAKVPALILPGTFGFAGGFTLGGTGGVNETYILLTASNLLSPVWTPIATNVTGTNGVFNFTDPAATNLQQFYQLKAQ